jgi:hypothetical protein
MAAKPKCPCPTRCKYCGAQRKRDSVGHYCGTRNCQWEFAFKCCTLNKQTGGDNART